MIKSLCGPSFTAGNVSSSLPVVKDLLGKRINSLNLVYDDSVIKTITKAFDLMFKGENNTWLVHGPPGIEKLVV